MLLSSSSCRNGDGESGAEQTEPAVQVDTSGGHQRRLHEQQQEPRGEDDAVHVEDGLGCAVRGPIRGTTV
jgi:hypothetical protein